MQERIVEFKDLKGGDRFKFRQKDDKFWSGDEFLYESKDGLPFQWASGPYKGRGCIIEENGNDKEFLILNNNMKPNKTNILNSIKSMTSICDKGKKEVISLVEAIIGEKLEEQKPEVTWKVGEVFQNSTFRVSIFSDKEQSLFWLGGFENDLLRCYPYGTTYADRQALTEYLTKNNYKKIGKLGFVAI